MGWIPRKVTGGAEGKAVERLAFLRKSYV